MRWWCLLTVPAAAALATADAASTRRGQVVAALKRFDQLAAMSSRGDPEGCKSALNELCALDDAGVVFELGPNAYNRAMKVCAGELDVAESLYARLSDRGSPDAASLEAIVSIRLEHDVLEGAASALADLLESALEIRTSKSGRQLPRRKLPERTVRVARAVFDACAEAAVQAEPLSRAQGYWDELGELGLWAPPPPPPAPERTLALLKPDCLRKGHDGEIEAFIAAHGFTTVRRRCWQMDAEEAADFLQTSWGSSAGDRERRFFGEMVDFYCSGPVMALLLERDGAITAWRQLLGPGDPAVARGFVDRFGRKHRPKAPDSVRARWGENKQANSCHGSDSPEAAAREIEFVFGEEWCEVGPRSNS